MIGRLLTRASTLANPAPWVLDSFAGPQTYSGARVTQDTALAISAVWRAVDLIGNALKSLPLEVFRRIDGGKERVTEHPCYALLHERPNPTTTPSRFKKYLASCVLLWGNGYAEIERRLDGEPIALWPIHPRRVTVKRNGNDVSYSVASDGRTDELDSSQVFHVMGLSCDGIQGASVIRAARESLGLTQSAEQYGAEFYGNDARPSIVLEHPGTLGDKARENLRASWMSEHGSGRRHGVHVSEEGMKVSTIGMPNDDAQFLETRAFQVVEVARWFGVPPHKLMDLSRATFSNIEHLAIEFVGDAIMPYAIDWEEEAERKLIGDSESDLFAEFNLNGLLRADTKARFDAYAVGRNWGWLSANDVRRFENMNPLPDDQGDIYLVPANMVSADAMADAPDTPDAQTANAPEPPPQVPSPPPQEDESEAEADANPFGKCAGIARAWALVLAADVRRMAGIEETARERAAKAGKNLSAWANEFYDDFGPKLRAALGPAADGYVHSIAVVCGRTANDGRIFDCLSAVVSAKLLSCRRDPVHESIAGLAETLVSELPLACQSHEEVAKWLPIIAKS